MKESYFWSKYMKPLCDKYLIWHMNTTIDHTNKKLKGLPDIIGQLPNGKLIGIELKNETRLAEPEQIEWRKYIIDNNAYSYIVFLDKTGRTKIGERALKNRVEKGYTPYSEFENILKEICGT